MVQLTPRPRINFVPRFGGLLHLKLTAELCERIDEERSRLPYQPSMAAFVENLCRTALGMSNIAGMARRR